MGELKELVTAANVTPTHRFIKDLEDQNSLLRCYTQNIDGMETRLGMSSALEDDKIIPDGRIVRLHGDLDTLKCTLCRSKYAFTPTDVDCFKGGSAPACPNCLQNDGIRTALGNRSIRVGLLKPNIVLYNEPHESGELIADLSSRDIRKRPDLLIVMGTSLKVHGIKKLVKNLAHAAHAVKHGKVILVNRVDLAASEWDHIFDYHIKSDTDDAVVALKMLVNQLEIKAAKNNVARSVINTNRTETRAMASPSPVKPISSGRSISPVCRHENALVNHCMRINCHERALIKIVLVKYDRWWCQWLDATSEKKKKEIFEQNPRHLAYRLQRFAKAYLAPKGVTDRKLHIEENLRHMMDCSECNTISKLVENRGKRNCQRVKARNCQRVASNK